MEISLKNKPVILFILSVLLIVLYIDLFPEVMKDWQTLIAGSMAALAAFVTVSEMKAQLDFQKEIIEAEKRAKRLSGNVKLKFDLDSLSDLIQDVVRYDNSNGKLFNELILDIGYIKNSIDSSEYLNNEEVIILDKFIRFYSMYILTIKNCFYDKEIFCIYKNEEIRRTVLIMKSELFLYVINKTLKELCGEKISLKKEKCSYIKEDIFNDNKSYEDLFAIFIDIDRNPDKYANII